MTGAAESEALFVDGQGQQKKLPNMNEFSPGTLGTSRIKDVLSLLAPHQGNKAAMVQALLTRPRLAQTSDAKQRSVRAGNVLIGMSQCGLLSRESSRVLPVFTELGNQLLAMSDEEATLAFAKHLLLEAHGLELIDAVEMIRARGERVDSQSIRDELRARQFVVTENEGNPSKIRLWLEAAGLVSSEWIVEDAALRSLIGVGAGFLQVWNGLTRAQRVFAKQAKSLDVVDEGQGVPVRQIKKLCEISHHRIFPEGHLREKVVQPLVAAGLLEAQGTGTGRGGDSGNVRVCDSLRELQIELPSEGMSGIPTDLRDKLATPLSTIISDLDNASKNKRGIALELLALRLVRDIGLFPVCFRERSAKTQEAEVDLIAQGVHLHYSRWLVQCKNTASVEVSDIAKEVGMAVVLKAHVILMVTTGTFRRTVQTYANGLASSSALQAILVDGALLKKYQQSGAAAIIEGLQKNAYNVLALKAPQVREED
jgi:hypothetical protein